MFEDITPESIKSGILSRVGSTMEQREGGFLSDMVSPVALELWKCYQAMNALIPIAYVDESSGGYIDLRCAEYGIVRKAGTRARAALTLTGRAGTVIPEGTAFLTGDGLAFGLMEPVTLTGGADPGSVEADAVGRAYNIRAGELTQMVNTISGLESWSNADAEGGTDEETDAALCARLYEHLQKPATSGNTYHYERWAKEVNGVGDAKVTPLWNGPGTVKVLIVGPDKEPVSSEIVTACAAYIDAQRPIGATVTVSSAAGLSIEVSASVTLDGTTTAPAVESAFAERVGEYIRELAFRGYTLLYNRVAFFLLDIDGVVDYTSLSVNGGTGNVSIGAEQVPVLGEVSVT